MADMPTDLPPLPPDPSAPLGDSNRSGKARPDYGLFVGVIFGVVSIVFFVLQADGVDVNWWVSALIYLGCAIAAAWTTLFHAVPDRDRGTRYGLAAILLLVVILLGSIGTTKEYRREHATDKFDDLLAELRKEDQQRRFLEVYPLGYAIFDLDCVTGSVMPIQARQGLGSYEFDFKSVSVVENTPKMLTIQLPDILENGVHVIGHRQAGWEKAGGPSVPMGFVSGTPPHQFAATAQLLDATGDHAIWVYGLQPVKQP